MEVAQLAFWDHDFVSDRVERSPEWAEMLGYTLEEVGSDPKFWLDRIHSEDRGRVDRAIRRHHQGEVANLRVEHRVRAKDGQWKWVQNWGRIVERDDNGTARRALGFHMDITERKHAELAMVRTEKLSTIGTLAGGIAHDFNNLLTVIRGNLQLAKETGDDGARLRFLGNAERATHRSQELTGRLLTFAKGGAPTLEPVDLERVIIEARDLVLSGSASRVRIECEPGLPPVAGSTVHLVQVLQNLLLNASQSMPEGGIITATCKRSPLGPEAVELLESGEYVQLIVTDQGPGITRDVADHIFDPFFTTRPDGKGLGLATAHSIIADHHGLLDVLSADAAGDVNELTTGASFRVLLPIAGEELTRRPASMDPIEAHTGARVLVVDDDALVRELASTVVQNLGLIAVEADDGAKAVELYCDARERGEPFVVVLMDLTIPGGMGGKEAVVKILEQDPQARVIVSSGYSEDPVMASYRDYGFCACLSKPYRLEEVREVIAKAMSDESSSIA